MGHPGTKLGRRLVGLFQSEYPCHGLSGHSRRNCQIFLAIAAHELRHRAIRLLLQDDAIKKSDDIAHVNPSAYHASPPLALACMARGTRQPVGARVQRLRRHDALVICQDGIRLQMLLIF